MYRQMSEKSKPDKKCLWENGPGDASTQARNSKFCLKVLNEYMGKVSNSQKTSPSRFLYREERLPGGGGRITPSLSPPLVMGLNPIFKMGYFV